MSGKSTVFTLTILLVFGGSSTFGQSTRMPPAGTKTRQQKSQDSRRKDQRHNSPRSRHAWQTKTGNTSKLKKRPKVEKVAFRESATDGVEIVPIDGCASGPCECLRCVRKRATPNVGERIWGRAEYLHWWTKGMGTPALATTNPVGTSQDDAGVLGAAKSSILFGGDDLSDGSRSGGRFTLGMWLDPCQAQAIAVTYTGLQEETDTFEASNDDFSILARPFFNAETGLEDSRLIAFPPCSRDRYRST